MTRNQKYAAMAAAGALVVGLLAWQLIPTEPLAPVAASQRATQERAQARRMQAACASQATYDRLKQVMFDDAIRERGESTTNLDTLSRYATVRMEAPRVRSRDEKLDVTLCTGRLIIDIPPGAERAFGGERRLTADIEYSAQAAADGSGLVYQIEGAEQIVTRLARFDLQAQAYRPPEAAPVETAEMETEPPLPELREPVAPAPVAIPTARPDPPRAVASPAFASPSFDCRRARSRSERMVCGDASLAALDREMSARFYAALDGAGRRTRNALRDSRDRFLAYRDRCPDEACVAEAYRDRMDEIRDIAAGG